MWPLQIKHPCTVGWDHLEVSQIHLLKSTKCTPVHCHLLPHTFRLVVAATKQQPMQLTVSFEHCFSKFKLSMELRLAPFLCYRITYLFTYLLTPWCRVLPEQLTGLQLVKKSPTFHGTQRFITALTSLRHLSLSWVSPIQSIYPHPTTWRSILILSTHLCLGLPSVLLPSSFPTKNIYTPLSSPIRYHITQRNFLSLESNGLSQEVVRFKN